MTAIIDGVIKDEIPFPAMHLIFSPFFAVGTLISGGRMRFFFFFLKKNERESGVKEAHLFHLPSSMRKGD